ncbi:hypothetical protein [Peribacillus simplex]|uniref:hypothetical protein n=1 Tax=Peribacillus simplex TaxID=1478 RepID=UPI0016235EC1|nr:hypothetical protein [Peribacillus simplex]
MSMKMFKMSVVALIAALLFPSSTFASGWGYLGEETLILMVLKVMCMPLLVEIIGFVGILVLCYLMTHWVNCLNTLPIKKY